MRIRISPRDGVPIYLQIVKQVKYLVASGLLAPGDQLPTVRRLASDLLVNPNTVARAYRRLESEGVLVTRRGSGVFVSNAGSPLAGIQKKKILSERIDVLLAEARQMGITLDELVRLLRKRDKNMKKK